MDRASGRVTVAIRNRLWRPPDQSRSIAPQLRVFKNIAILTLGSISVNAVLLPIRCFLGISTLAKVIGPISFFIVYSIASLSSATFSSRMCHKLGHKNTLILCFLSHLVLLAASVYMTYYTLIIAAIILGLSLAPIHISACSYVVSEAAQLTYFSDANADDLIDRFLSIVFAASTLGAVIGHSVTATVLASMGIDGGPSPEILNDRYARELLKCGRWYCNNGTHSALPVFSRSFSAESGLLPVPSATVLAGLGVSAPLVVLLLLDRVNVHVRTVRRQASIRARAGVSKSTPKSRVAMRVAPMAVSIGMIDGFIACDVVKALGQCTSAMPVISYISIAQGAAGTLVFASLGTVLQHISRPTVLGAGAMFQSSCFVILWIWRPDPADKAVIFVLMCCCAMAIAVLKTLVQTLLFRIFRDTQRVETPFAFYATFELLGTAISYLQCPFGCTEYKIYATAALFLLALIPCGRLEWTISKQEPRYEGCSLRPNPT